ncbi:tetraspanin-2A isoform X2 [Procambarus clarkii]|uniref:tetraspanin-2A isoform X2 n=1 Tax=Procambarus clarkii TaxID=6728 RepID=UPI001E672B78|nr:tetraspanin-2A-like isoform X2 [Procambarus clarkii]
MAHRKVISSLDQHVEILQYILYIFNTIFFIAASALFALTLWVRFRNEMGDYIEGLSIFYYWNANTVFMYMVMTVIIFILLLAASAFLLDNGLEDSHLLPFIQDSMRSLIHQYQWDVAARRSVDIIQENIGCCGGYSADDYSTIHLPVPDTCRDQITGNQFKYSCGEVLSQYLEILTGWITGISLSICLFQCFSMVATICLWHLIREMESR